jgi:hypothetical protein
VGSERRRDHGNGEIGIRSPGWRIDDLGDLDARVLESLHCGTLPETTALIVEGAEHDGLIAGLQTCPFDDFLTKISAELSEVGADIASTELGDHLWDGDVGVVDPNTGLRGLLRQRHDRGVTGVAHHDDTVGSGSHSFSQLLNHFLDVPA